MTHTKPLPNTAYQSGPLLSPREEAERFAIAAQTVLKRARQDPEYARQILSDIGYYEMMDQDKDNNDASSTNGDHTNGANNGVKSANTVTSKP